MLWPNNDAEKEGAESSAHSVIQHLNTVVNKELRKGLGPRLVQSSSIAVECAALESEINSQVVMITVSNSGIVVLAKF